MLGAGSTLHDAMVQPIIEPRTAIDRDGRGSGSCAAYGFYQLDAGRTHLLSLTKALQGMPDAV